MKLRLIKYLTIVTILFAGCNELLEAPEPPTSVSGSAVLTSEAGVNAMRASIYSQLRASFDYTTEYFIGPSAFADETRTRAGATRFQDLNTANSNDGGTSGLSSYGSTYGIILDANILISGVDVPSMDQATLDQYRGEAYAIRAMTMHHLVRALGYEPGMSPATGPGAGWDLGIIIRTEPTLDISDVDNRPRATVSAVYDQILLDLGEAKTLLAGQTNNEYITEAFVDGMIARVNLYAGNWAAADDAAQNAINNGPALVTTAAGVAGMFDETAGNHPEALFKLVVDPNTEQIAGSNVNNGLAAYSASQWVSQVPTQGGVLDLYDPADLRLGWYGPCTNEQQGSDLSGTCTGVNTNGWEIRKWQGENGNLSDDIPYMRVAEMYLIQAEAKLKEPGGSIAAAIGPLNTLRAARGLTAVAAGDFADADALMDEILDERVRELVAEGHRFWDLKRLGMDIPNPDGSTKIRYDSYRILDDIGQGEIDINPELDENPGYLD